jgi:hypothetical protein
MATIDSFPCISNVGNTGIQPCSLDYKLLQGAYLGPKGDEIDVTNLQTALAAKVYNPNKSARWYPVYGFETPTFNSEKKTIQTMANSAKHVVKEGFADWMFQRTIGGLSAHKALRLFNGPDWDFMFFDNDPKGQKFMGITGSAATKLKMIPSDQGFFWADYWTPNTGSAVAEYTSQFVFDGKYVNDLVRGVQANFDLTTMLPGLIDVNLVASATVNATSGSFNICIVSPLGVDIGAKYSAALAAPGAWTAKNTATSAAIVPSGATWVPSTTSGVPGYFTVVVPTAAPPYPASGTVTFSLVDPSVLTATPYGVAIEPIAPVAITRS